MNRRSDPFEHRRALLPILQDIHRRAAVAALQQFGFEVEEWDPELIARLDPNNEISDAYDFSIARVRYEANTHHASIFGPSTFRLIWSSTPSSYDFTFIGETDMQRAMHQIEAPLKVVGLQREGVADSTLIVVGLDTPPMAADMSALDTCPGEPDDPRTFQLLADQRPWNVDYLIESTRRCFTANSCPSANRLDHLISIAP